MQIDHLTTEQTNESSNNIDSLSSLEIVNLMNREDLRCIDAVENAAAPIAAAIDIISSRVRAGGRLFYMGAGTSGRLGVLDASECPPTFNTDPGQVIGIIAGGMNALTTAIEGAEDNQLAAQKDLVAYDFSAGDVLVGIGASGRTPYVIGGLQYARSIGATTISVTCNSASEFEPHSDIVIAAVVGPEILSGSTRLKSGTATKMILNMLTTGTMIRIGKTYGNWMVDLRATNAKLVARSIRIVSSLANVSPEQARGLLDQCDGEVKVAIVSGKLGLDPGESRLLLENVHGHLRSALENS